MILLDKWRDADPAQVSVPEHLFSKAMNLHRQERFGESIDYLNRIFSMDLPVGKVSSKNLWDVFALYGWNLFFLKNAEELNEWRDTVLSLAKGSPPFSIFLIDCWRMALIGEYEKLISLSDPYLNDNTIDERVSGLLFIRGFAKYFLGNLSGSMEDLEVSYSTYRYFGNVFEAARVSNFLGVIYLKSSEYRDAEKWLLKTLKYYRKMNQKLKQSMVLLNLGICGYKTGNYQVAAGYLQKSLDLSTEGGWFDFQSLANIALGNVCRLTRDFETARKHLHAAYNQAQQLQMRREEALALEFLGDVYRDEGRPDEARRFYKRALAIALDIAPEGDIVMEVERRLGECFDLEGEPDKASEHLTNALQMARVQGDRFEEGVTLRAMAETTLDLGDISGALETITQSVDLLDEIGAKHEMAISLLRRGELRLLHATKILSREELIARGAELDEAWEDATRALDLLLRVDVPWWTEKARNLAERVSFQKSALEKEKQEARIKPGRGGGYQAPNIIIHTSGIMRDMLQLCDMFAAGEDPVLICGETGTGKELVARRIHAQSPRRDKPLVTVNVAAIAPTMFEREFFGHVRGSFSGAERDSLGFAASADGGTLFLDEIGELPRDMQPKLLRLIQDGTYQALGDPKTRRTNIRLVAATNADLGEMVEKGEFRSDLYYRLKVLELNVPPVRRRRDDILPLLRHFLSMAAGRPVEPIEYFSGASLDRLLEYTWPGNVREVAMVARRAAMEMKIKGRVRLDLGVDQDAIVLTGPDRRMLPAATRAVNGFGGAGKAERARILMALEECGGNRNAAARKLGVGRSTLYRRMEKLGIPTRKD